MPSEENNGNVFPMLNGIATFMQGAIAVFTKASEWYRDNEENIKNFLIGFSNFSTCCSAIEKMAEHQIMFSDDISITFADSIWSTADVDALVEDYYFGNDEQHIKNVIRRCDTAQQLKDTIICLQKLLTHTADSTTIWRVWDCLRLQMG